MLLDRSATLAIVAPYTLDFVFEHHISFVYMIKIFTSIYSIKAFRPFLFIKGNCLTILKNSLNFIEYFEVVDLDCLLLLLVICSVFFSSEFSSFFEIGVFGKSDVGLHFIESICVVLVDEIRVEGVTITSFAVKLIYFHFSIFIINFYIH
jgi:hypothetical protein